MWEAFRVKAPTPEAWIQSIVDGVRYRAVDKSHHVDISREFLRKRWEEIGGKCEVTRLPFDLTLPKGRPKNPYQPSLDRIDASR